MYTILQDAHTYIRWLVLVMLIFAIIGAGRGLLAGRLFSKNHRRIASVAMSSVHLQALIGMILYFVSPKVHFTGNVMSDTVTRFYTVEHISMMLIAVVLITLGFSRSKRAGTDNGKFRNVFWFYLVALLLIVAAIPWPFREALGGTWG